MFRNIFGFGKNKKKGDQEDSPGEPHQSRRPRDIRVFVSSTFNDMQEDRNELAAVTFPSLRKLCESRGVVWGEVDLRWGILDEEKAEGKVLPICLEEIERCRPYFIGLLGERYGWTDTEISRELIEREPWLAGHKGESVTELEILHGVLNNPEMANHAFFYFRDPAYADSLPPDKKAMSVGHSSGSADKLTALKDRIRESGFPVRENYRDPEHLAELVHDDMKAVIDRRFPETDVLDPLERDADEHEWFAESRYRIYIGRNEYIDKLNEHVEGNETPLAILGKSGSGKSALTANWAKEYREKHPKAHFIMHFIGATPYGTNWTAMLRRIMGELNARFDIKQEIPSKDDELKPAFARFLFMAARKGRVILILDALNQLEDREGAQELVWLPPIVPENIRLIVSTLPGKSLDEIKKRGWPTLEIKPLDIDERKILIRDYLAQYSHKLNNERTNRMASAPQSHSPLFLRVLLEELKFATHEELDERINHYLAAHDVPTLFRKVLDRWEKTYERDRSGLVHDSMTAIWASRHGLEETELLQMLGEKGIPLPQNIWAPLHIAAGRSLISRTGLIGFFHDFLRQAVKEKYLNDENLQTDAHGKLADYFESHKMTDRGVDEYPWQLAEAKEWKRLFDLLSDLEFFEKAWKKDEWDVRKHWVKVENGSGFRMVDAYKRVLEHQSSVCNLDVANSLAFLHYKSGHLEEADRFWRLLAEDAESLRSADPNKLAASLGTLEFVKRVLSAADGRNTSLGNRALILRARGDRDGAMRLLKEQEGTCRLLGDTAGLAGCLDNQAMLLKDSGDLDNATRLFAEVERMSRELGYPRHLAASLGNQALILKARGDLEGAMKLHKEQERIYRESGDAAGLSLSIGNQALILILREDYDAAMELLKEQERICRELGELAGLGRSLNNQGVILSLRGDFDGAMRLSKESEKICRELGNPTELAHTLGGQALILRDRGDVDGALRILKKVEHMFRELQDPAGLQDTLLNKASILQARGNLVEATRLLKEQERICRELGNPAGFHGSLGYQAGILKSLGDLDGAIKLLKEQETICRRSNDRNGLQVSLESQAVILKARGDLDSAMKALKEQEGICRELDDPAGVERSLGNQAVILRALGDSFGAMRLHKDKERICRELGDLKGLQISLGNQAVILKSRGDLDGAMKLMKEQERICRGIGDQEGLSGSLGNQAAVFQDRGDFDAAMKLHKQEERIFRKINNSEGLAICLINQAAALYKSGASWKAAQVANEALDLASSHGLTALAEQIRATIDQLK